MTIQEVAIVVDRSGSMAGKEADTVGGINTTLSQLRQDKEEGTTINITLILFDNEQITKWSSKNLDEITEFPISEFIPRGGTALLDAMGDTITSFVNKKQSNSSSFDSCVIYVSTDGAENGSKNYNISTLKNLIASAESVHDIKVLYLGANQDAILVANSMGICADRAINYSENQGNIEAVYRSVATSASRTRNGQETAFTHSERQASQLTGTSPISPAACTLPVPNLSILEPPARPFPDFLNSIL